MQIASEEGLERHRVPIDKRAAGAAMHRVPMGFHAFLRGTEVGAVITRAFQAIPDQQTWNWKLYNLGIKHSLRGNEV